MKLKCLNLDDPSTVDRILREIKAKLQPGEYFTIHDLKLKLFDSIQMTTGEWVYFVKVHGTPIFEKYLIREHPRLLRDNYQMKSTEQSGVEQHGQ
jgi:hypothetical protein